MLKAERMGLTVDVDVRAIDLETDMCNKHPRRSRVVLTKNGSQNINPNHLYYKIYYYLVFVSHI